jgi:amphi-Trp domain-containing protein
VASGVAQNTLRLLRTVLRLGGEMWHARGMALLETETEEQLRREEVAERLRQLADVLSRRNQVEFTREGLRYTLKVPDQVEYSLEIEITEEGGEIEVELKW